MYITSLGLSADASNEWARGRWEEEQFLLKCGLDVTILRPGQIVGMGGMGFKMIVFQAKGKLAVTMGSGKQKFQSIAIDDLVYYLIEVLQDSRTFGKAYDVGGDEVLSYNQMIDIIADVLGKKAPVKLHMPTSLLTVASSFIERQRRLPKGSLKGFFESIKTDLVGNPLPIRMVLPRQPVSYREAVMQALRGG